MEEEEGKRLEIDEEKRESRDREGTGERVLDRKGRDGTVSNRSVETEEKKKVCNKE